MEYCLAKSIYKNGIKWYNFSNDNIQREAKAMSKKQKETAGEISAYDMLRNKYHEIKTEIFIINLAMIVLGLVMVIIPGKFNEFIGQILGCVLCIWGVLHCITFLRLKKDEAFGSNALVVGAAMIGFGIFFIADPNRFSNILNSVLVLAVFIAAVFKLQNAINYFKVGIYKWWLHFFAAAVLTALGVIALIKPGWVDSEAGLASMVTIIAGCALIISGVWDAFSVLVLSKRLKKTVKEMEAEGVIPSVTVRDNKKNNKAVRLSEKDVTEKKTDNKKNEEHTEFSDPELDEIDKLDYGDDFDEDRNADKKNKKK